MYNSTEGNQLIIVMTEREVLFNDICNGLYHNDLEDCDLVLVNTLKKTREGLSRREMSGARESRESRESRKSRETRGVVMFDYPSQKNSRI